MKRQYMINDYNPNIKINLKVMSKTFFKNNINSRRSTSQVSNRSDLLMYNSTALISSAHNMKNGSSQQYRQNISTNDIMNKSTSVLAGDGGAIMNISSFTMMMGMENQIKAHQFDLPNSNEQSKQLRVSQLSQINIDEDSVLEKFNTAENQQITSRVQKQQLVSQRVNTSHFSRRQTMNKSQVNFNTNRQMNRDLMPVNSDTQSNQQMLIMNQTQREGSQDVQQNDAEILVSHYQNFLSSNRQNQNRTADVKKRTSLLKKQQNLQQALSGITVQNNHQDQFTKSQVVLPTVNSQDQKLDQSKANLKPSNKVIQTQRKTQKSGAIDIDMDDMKKAYKDASKYSSRFVEQWINDTLEECHDLGIPGVISRPEHKLPLSRHGLDRITLTNMGIPNELVNRIYRSLFVYTIGFYELMFESTKSLNEKRVSTQSQIWKVYQILLEFCCQTDYKLITQQLEKQHQEEYEEMESKYRETIHKLELSEQELKQELRKLVAKIDELQFERTNQDQEKTRMLMETKKYQQKHEEEVQLRLFFESKLNSLHHINREITKKFQVSKLKHADECIKTRDLDHKIQNLLNENTKYRTNNEILNQQIINLHSSKETVDVDKSDLQLKLKELDVELTEQKKMLAFYREQYDASTKEKNAIELKLSALQDFVDTKVNEHTNIQSFLEETTLRQQQMETELQQMKLKEERTRSKLKFYKAQYTGFEVTKKSFQEEIKQLRQEVRILQDQTKEAKDDNQANQVRVTALDRRVFELLNENEEITEKFRVTTLVRHDLEQQLKQQIEQTKKMFQDRDLENKSMLQMKRDMTVREFRLKDVEDEKNDLEQTVIRLENELEQLQAKYESNQMNLRSLVENEKDSRDTWKERFERENQSAVYLNKQITQFKNENLDFRNKVTKYESQVGQLKEEKENLKEQKDSLTQKLHEALGQIERFEREVFIKRSLLDDFETKKKSELQVLRKSNQQQLSKIRYYEMLCEDLSSDLLRSSYKYQKLEDQIEKLDDSISNYQSKINQQKQNYNELLKDKLLAQKSVEEKDQQIDEIFKERQELKSKIERFDNHIESLNNQITQYQDTIASLESHIEDQLQQLSDIGLERDGYIRKLGGGAASFDRTTQYERNEIGLQEIGVQADIGGRRQSIFQNKGDGQAKDSANNSQNLKDIIKGTLSGSPGRLNSDQDHSYANTNQSQKKLKPMFQFNNSQKGSNQSRPFTGEQIQEEDDAYKSKGNSKNQTLEFDEERPRIQSKNSMSQRGAHNRQKSSDVTNHGQKRGHTTAGASRNKANLMTNNNILTKSMKNQKNECVISDAYNYTNTNTANMNAAGKTQTTGFGTNQHDITVRITTTDSKHPNQTFTETESNHKKKQSFGGDTGTVQNLMGCSSGKIAKKYVSITPEIAQKMNNKDIQRTVSLYPYQEFRLTKIDYQQIINQNEPWVDTYFRPELSSILDPNIPTTGRLKEWETYVWKRPKDVYGKDNYSVYKSIGPSDIKQGGCGDCYYLSSIASLAENPDRVKALFLTQEVNKAGCYAIKMYVNGEPQIVVVDDYFPFNERKNDWAFSRSSGEKEIWVLLLEKAWAKINGNYQRIEGGTTGEALPALTGAPSDFFYHAEAKNVEDIWTKVREADLKNYIIATAVSSQKQGKTSAEMTKMGLVDAHAYSLMSTHEVQDASGKKIRLLKIRNPWGFKEWTGDWSDKSTKWTSDIKDELGFEDKDDGVFYISFEDYVKFFYITTICKDIFENDLTVMPDEHGKHEYCIQKITVPKDQNSIISVVVHQLHARIADLQMKGTYRYAPMKLIFAKICKPEDQSSKSQQLVFIDGQYICYQHTHIELPKLTQGEYIVFFKAEWVDRVHLERRLVMNIYAPDPFQIERINSNAFSYEYIGELEDMLADRIDQGFSYQLPEYDIDGIALYNQEERDKITQIVSTIFDSKQSLQTEIQGFNASLIGFIDIQNFDIEYFNKYQLQLQLKLSQIGTNNNALSFELSKDLKHNENDYNFMIMNQDCPPVHLNIDLMKVSISDDKKIELFERLVDRLYVDRGSERLRNIVINKNIACKNEKLQLRYQITPYI